MKAGSFLFVLLLGCLSCKQQSHVVSPPGYDLGKPQVFKMPPELEEISGITFRGGVADTLYAEQDEEGKLYKVALPSLNTTHKKFGKKGDYEDIAILGNMVTMLRSDGTLYSFAMEPGEADFSYVNEVQDLMPKGEYEGMYADEKTQQLYIICKKCAEEDEDEVAGYIVSTKDGLPTISNSAFQISVQPIADMLKLKKLTLRPSALTKNPLTGEWFILSSVNKLLVVTDEQWKLKGAYPLKPSQFPQPEGITFDKEGNLYISNERGSTSSGTVLKFMYKKPS